MRIQHNISAINTARQLSTNETNISTNLQRLSSGYRINSAADDAAGLAISEKMRSQINGLDQSENNAEDGISLVKTGEGNLNETSSILQRMNELALESSNGTYQNGTDRTSLQKELTALQTEIDRISTSANFNQISLLDGSLSNEGADIRTSDMVTTYTDGDVASTASVTLDFNGLSGKDLIGKTLKVGGTIYEFEDEATTVKGSSTNTKITVAAEATAGDIAAAVSVATAAADAASGSIITVAASAMGTYGDQLIREGSAEGVIFQIGTNSTSDQRVGLTVSDMNASALGVGNKDISIESQSQALDAIAKIKTAINTVSSTRADFGALENRLDHTVNNLSTTSENLTSAESRIRDVDMSSEMVDLTKNQILEQAATAMLAQANTQPQGVLQLLK